MAEDDAEAPQAPEVPKDKTAAAQARALGAMTGGGDDGEERESTKLDSDRVKSTMAALAAAQRAEKEEKAKREKDLAAVKIAAADVDVIVAECEVERRAAERRLREHGGNLYDALKSYL